MGTGKAKNISSIIREEGAARLQGKELKKAPRKMSKRKKPVSKAPNGLRAPRKCRSRRNRKCEAEKFSLQIVCHREAIPLSPWVASTLPL